MSSIVNALVRSPLGRLPVPVFGSVAVLTSWAKNSSRGLMPGAVWGFPLVVGGLWFVWPAVDDDWKVSMGFKRNPNPPAVAADPVEFDEEAKKAIANAYKPPAEAVVSAKDKQIEKELRSGVTTTLEQEWDEFLVKSTNPGEDDDEDDDEEEEEEEDDDDDDDDE